MITDNYLKGLDYLEPFQVTLPPWMDEIKTEGLKRKVPIVDDDMGRFLRILCMVKKPKDILEIGCGISYATHWMLLGNDESNIIALDYNQERLDICEKYLKKSGFSGKVQLKRQWALDFFASEKLSFDLIFQDSTKKDYAGMIENCYQCLNKEGLLIVDNIFFNKKVFGLSKDQEKKYKNGVESLKQFTEKVAAHPGLECHFFSISDGVLVAKRK